MRTIIGRHMPEIGPCAIRRFSRRLPGLTAPVRITDPQEMAREPATILMGPLYQILMIHARQNARCTAT